MTEKKQAELIDSVEEFKFDPIKGYPMLTWRGKRPFRSTLFYPAQLKETHGDPTDSWYNRIYWGDNLQVMSHLLKDFRGKVDLIYIDPPFDSRVEYKKKIRLMNKSLESDVTSFEEKQYSDIWSNDEYLQFMYERFVLLRELLSAKGTIYLHTDYHKSHHLRCIMDEIFGAGNFVNEITWHYYNKMAPDSKCFPRASDKILAYAKEIGNHVFHKQLEKRDKAVKQLVRKFVDGKAINARDDDGNVMYRDSTHKRVDDVWRMSMLQPADKTENVNYPTQKPATLVERIIRASSEPGDLVLDCFMGAGTTQECALRLGRRFIGADINLTAIHTTTNRLIGTIKEWKPESAQSEAAFAETEEIEKKPTKFFRNFQIYNVNHYDVFRNPVQAKDLLKEALEIQSLDRNTIFDGEKDGRMVKIMPVNRIATRADLNELITNFDYKLFEKRQGERPNQPVERITLVCMGHEPDLAAILQHEVGYKLDVEVVDILRDRGDLQFKRDAEAAVVAENGTLKIAAFYPLNLLQKLSYMKENVQEWRELVESVMVDWNYNGSVFEPELVDIPERDGLVKGEYPIPANAKNIRIKITDLLSESLEMGVANGSK